MAAVPAWLCGGIAIKITNTIPRYLLVGTSAQHFINIRIAIFAFALGIQYKLLCNTLVYRKLVVVAESILATNKQLIATTPTQHLSDHRHLL